MTRRLMASFACYSSNGLRTAVIVMVICCLTWFPPTSVGSLFTRGSSEGVKQTKMVLGSRPPKCINRCASCKPCMAALVTPPHHKRVFEAESRGDESYYLLSWKCKCGDKYFQP